MSTSRFLSPRIFSLRAGALAAGLCLAAPPQTLAQRTEQVVTLVRTADAGPGEAVALPGAGRAELAEYKANYRMFSSTRVGVPSPPEVFTLSFHAPTQVTGIAASNDFHVSGGSCAEHRSYAAGDQCTVEVTFTPRGPGHRTGNLKIAHTASAEPMLVPTGGDATGPAVAFIPAQIETLPGTFTGGKGLLLKPQSLTVDDGDNLYITDTGNNLIRYMDSSGAITTLAGGGTNSASSYSGAPTGLELSHPYGVAVTTDGVIYISDTGNHVVRAEILGLFASTEIGGGTTSVSSCESSAPCASGDVALTPPAGIAVDPDGNLFLNLPNAKTGEVSYTDITAGSVTGIYSLADAVQSLTTTYPIAVDAADIVYTTGDFPGSKTPDYAPVCSIYGQYLNAPADASEFLLVAGTARCGFSGDGGLATGAEIGGSTQGMALDAAGDFYFTDTANNRVRRIDGATGIIHTLAGDGGNGYTGDGEGATSAEVHAPSGVGVDSQGNVYTTGLVSGAGAAVVRKIGPSGLLSFGSQAEKTVSAAETVLVTNTGNDVLNLDSIAVTEGDTGDFAVSATTCSMTEPLAPGRSCEIGVAFTPTATGSRTATLTLFDDAVAGSNSVLLNGTGAKPAVARLAPEALVFAPQKAETASAKSVVLENTGGMPLGIHSFAFTGSGARDFAETHNCGVTLDPGAKCTIDVRFTPPAEGAHAATLEVETSAGSAALRVSGTSE
jgi:sugar lactone lactonase YvrE